MINDLREENQNLIWFNDSGEEKRIRIESGTYIYSEDYIFLMNADRDSVKVYNDNKQVIAEIHNSNSIYLMYLCNHFKFGLSIVASVKSDDCWIDRYFIFDGNKFIPVSEAH